MSATTEAIYEQIRLLTDEIKLLAESGGDPKEAQDQLRLLQKKLISANQALTEGRTLLKG